MLTQGAIFHRFSLVVRLYIKLCIVTCCVHLVFQIGSLSLRMFLG